MTQPVMRPKVTGIGIAVAVLLAVLEIYAAYGGIGSIIHLVRSGSNVGVHTYVSVLSGLLAIVVLAGVGMVLARRQSVGRILLWGTPVQLLCALVLLISYRSWEESVAFGLMTILAVVLWLPAVSAKTPPPAGYGMPYGAQVPGMPQYPGQVPMGQQYPGQQYPQPGPVPPQYPPQYGAPGMPQQYPPYPQQQPYPQQPMPGQWPASGPPQQGWPGQ
ncbi:hypothetical protein [Amycolatopsis orientalis]|uniref:hypothetical protein n=1 Tax=Amycolatopsis orientalis TaxID=31958 RepID=UPI0003A9358E|nr:hypothetical protein [Amycolatopsis orientalis]